MFYCNEAVIRQLFRELLSQVYTNVMQVVMFEVFESSEVKKKLNSHNFAVGHFTGANGAFYRL